MAYQGTPFAGTAVTIDSQAVALVTSVTESTTVTEVETTGAENTTGSAPEIAFQQFTPTAVGKTFELALVVTPSDQGQQDLQDAVDTGAEAVIVSTDQNGFGASYTGFFTAYNKTAALNGIYTATATFRVNAVTPQGS